MTTDAAGLVAAEHARRRAIEAGDADALDAMTADIFHYAHINGLVEDRATYLARIRAHPGTTPRTAASDLIAELRSGYALLRGTSRIDFALPSGETGTVETLFLSVWERHGPAWKIVAYASTPVPAA